MLFNASTFVAVLAGFSAVASAKRPAAHHAPAPPTGAALCRTSDVQDNIAAVKDNFSDAKGFCKWFVTPNGVRGGSPISDLNHAQFAQACGCITKRYDPNPKKVIAADDVPANFAPACRVAAHSAVTDEVSQPQKFCKFFQNQYSNDAPFANSKQILNGCECVLHPRQPTKGPTKAPRPKPTTTKTSTASTATKTSTSSAQTTSSSSSSSSSASVTAAPVATTSSSTTMDASAAATNTALGFAKRYHAAGNAAYRG